jgi:hypothetical protein
VALPIRLNPAPDTTIFETVVVAVPEFDRFTLRVVLLPTAIVPKLNEDGPTVNAGEFVSELDPVVPVKPMHPVWQSAKTKHAANMLKTLTLLNAGVTLPFATVPVPLSVICPSSWSERSNH